MPSAHVSSWPMAGLCVVLAACSAAATSRAPLAVTASQAVSIAATGRHERARCGPAAARTLVVGQYVRVYTYAHPTAAQHHDAFACDARSHVEAALVRYATDRAEIMPPPGIAVHGDLVAFGFDDLTNPDGAVTEIDVENLGHPPNFYTIIAGGATPDVEPAKIADVKLDGEGDAIWVACRSSVANQPDDRRLGGDFATGAGARCQHAGPEMWVYYTLAKPRSVQRKLDHGNAIDPLSLRLDGSIATWRAAGRTRSADISQPAARRH